MRLTLRALLAYLDDVLEPATLKEIGTRVSESAPAAATVARIKEVVRRRRIAAPELTGSGSAPDPNIVAEYLDNTLDPSGVPALEKLCLESDMHLAEVASSHQILTAVLGEPIEVPVSTRERMYALVNHAPPVGSAPQPEATAAASTGVSPQVATTRLPARPVVPDYLQSSWGKKLVGSLLLVGLSVSWAVWVVKDQGFFPSAGGEPVAVVVDVDGATPAETTTPANPDTHVAATGTPKPATPEPVPSAPATSEYEANALADNGAATKPLPADPASPTPMPEPALPMVEAPTVVGLEPQPEPEPPVPVEPAAKPFPAMMYVNSEGILVARDRQSGQWNVMPRRALVHGGDELGTPDPFQSEFTVNGTTLEMTLFGGARVRLEPGVGAELLAVYVDRGRVAFRRPLAGGAQEPVLIGLSVRGQKAALTLSDPGTQCGVEVGQRAPQGHVPDPLLPQPEGGLHVVTGSASLAWNGRPAVVVGSDVGWAAWPVAPNPVQVGPLRAIPNWLAPEGVSLTGADKNLTKLYEKEFAVDQSLNMSIPALVSDRREHISALATYTLGLVDDIPMLVKALQSEHEKTRQAAIWNLRGWLPSDPNNTAVLEMEVARLFPDEDVSDVVDLLWGYPDSAAKDPVISRKLVELMDHKELAIRELAFFHTSHLVPRTASHGYRPALAQSPRNAALMNWRTLLDRNGGQLQK